MKNRRTISRTLMLTYCVGVRFTNGISAPVNEVIPGCIAYTAEQATKKLRKLYGDETLVIHDVQHEKCYFSMPIEQFIKEAECKILE